MFCAKFKAGDVVMNETTTHITVNLHYDVNLNTFSDCYLLLIVL